MEELDVLAVGSMAAPEREATMGKVFEQVMAMPEHEQIAVFKDLIGTMAEKATDTQYLNLCSTNLKLAANLPDTVLKPFLAMRMKSAAELPKNLAERDMKLLQEALSHSDPAVRNKIASNM